MRDTCNLEDLINNFDHFENHAAVLLCKIRHCSALLDTGADWSLIDESLLIEEERTELEHSGDHGLYGIGVSGESITILGEVWRTVTLGELCITEQRFVVVHGLSSRVILGADFWARVSPSQIDFHNRKLKLCGVRYEAMIFDPAEESETQSVESGNIRVLTALRCKLPPRTERLVKCRTDRGRITFLNPLVEMTTILGHHTVYTAKGRS